MPIEGNKVRASKSVKLLGVNIDTNLKFDEHIKDICSKAYLKVNVLHFLAYANF